MSEQEAVRSLELGEKSQPTSEAQLENKGNQQLLEVGLRLRLVRLHSRGTERFARPAQSTEGVHG